MCIVPIQLDREWVRKAHDKEVKSWATREVVAARVAAALEAKEERAAKADPVHRAAGEVARKVMAVPAHGLAAARTAEEASSPG